MPVWIIAAIVAITFFAMEGVAWATHKFVMHGFLWSLHKDHHQPDHDHTLERNDAFFLIFAIPCFVLFLAGMFAGPNAPWTWIALGILLYGLAYFFVHEVFIHQRIKWLHRTKATYFLALRKAHKVHHKHLDKAHGECFGMLFVPLKYLREVHRSKRQQAPAQR